jgi:hypothetical protein
MSLRHRVLVLPLVVVLAACNPATPSGSASPGSSASASGDPSGSPASPSGSLGADQGYEAIEDQVVTLRGLEPFKDVPRTTLDEDELRERLRQDFDEDYPADYIENSGLFLQALGLIPEGSSLMDLYLDLLGSQVAGFYDTDAEELFVISRSEAVGPNERITFAHEFTHALQDQHFDHWHDADSWLENSDLGLARTALSEGDATLLMTQWALRHLTPEDLQQVVSGDPQGLEDLEAAPAILSQTLLFPYTSGLTFVTELQVAAGWSTIDETYSSPPDSTEQILHPEKFELREDPIEVALPEDAAAQMGDGWTEALQDTLGELQISIWLDELGAPDVQQASAGWGGDRAILLRGPADSWALASVSEWDTADDADEFADAATVAFDALGRPGEVVHEPGSTRVTILLGSDQDAAIALEGVFGATGV